MKVEYQMLEIKTLTCDHGLWQKVAEYAKGCSWQPVGTDFSNNMKNNNFSDWERVFTALENGNIAGFCAITKTSTNFGDTYSPYIGMVFVGEDYRGNRISEKLCLAAIEYAKSIGFDKVYLYSDHVNLYEKYGFIKIDEKQAHWGVMQSIYERNIGNGGEIIKITKNALIPELSVTDIEKSKHFYIDILGFKIEYERTEDKFAFISYGEAQLMLEQVNGCWETGALEVPFGRGINIQIKTSDLDLLREKLLSNNITLFRDIEEFNYRQDKILHTGKELLVQDPDGYLLRFSQFD